MLFSYSVLYRANASEPLFGQFRKGVLGSLRNSGPEGPPSDGRIKNVVLSHLSWSYYVNVHNDPYPDGAIRGQLHRYGGSTLDPRGKKGRGASESTAAV